MPTLLGIFEQPDQVRDAAHQLRGRGYTDLEVFAPAPFPEIDEALDEKPSRVRTFTLVGGLAGVIAGFAMTLWMANDWQITVGGKPYSSIPPYTVIAFELTILFGGLMTALGLFVIGGLPRNKTHPAYHKRFSAEDFGLAVECRPRDVSEIDGLLREHSAVEVSLVEG